VEIDIVAEWRARKAWWEAQEKNSFLSERSQNVYENKGQA
jgi:hypothetical protein